MGCSGRASGRGVISSIAPPAQGMPFRILNGCECLAAAGRLVASAHGESRSRHGESQSDGSEMFSKYRPISPLTCLAMVIHFKFGPLLPPR